MFTFKPEWFLCGGWAADAWLGVQTREHKDIEVTVFQEDQLALFEHLAGWPLVGHDDNVADDSSEPWNGRRLDTPAHIHARPGDGFDFEVILNERSGSEWVFSHEPRITLPLSRCTGQSAWGLPAVEPEVILYYKALPPPWRNGPRAAIRRRDERDLVAMLPRLMEAQRSWLGEAISHVDPGHPWLARLSG